MLFKLAAEEYAASGNPGKAIEILDAVAGRYDVHASRLKLDILTLVLGSRDPARPGVPRPATVEPDIAGGIAETAMRLTDAACGCRGC